MRVTTRARSRKAAGFAGLRRTIQGLRDVASGKVLADTIARAERYLSGRVKGELKKHVDTGLALRTATVKSSATSIDLTLQSYRRYIKWSFAKGFPLSAINRFQKILSEELAKAVKGK